MTTNTLLTASVVGFLFGCFTSYNFSHSSFLGILALTVGLFFGGVVLFLYRKKKQGGEVVSVTFNILFLLSCITLSYFLGIVRIQLTQDKESFVCVSCNFSGEILHVPKIYDTRQEVVVSILGTPTYRSVKVVLPLYPEYRRGQVLHLYGHVKKVQQEKFGTNQFRYDTYLKTRGIGSESYYPKVASVISREGGLSFPELAHQKSVEQIHNAIDAPVSLLARSMVLGDDVLSSETKQNFRVTGISHITVLSGYNVALVVAMVNFLFKFFPFMLRVFFSIFSVLFFVGVTDGGASLLRASLMATIALLALMFGRGYFASRALLLTLCIFAVTSPYNVLHDVSLHLSFLATMGIIYVAPLCARWFQKYIPSSLVEVSAITFACTLVTLPYTTLMFGSVSVYAFIINMLVAPVVPLFTVGVMVVVLLSFISSTIASYGGVIVFLLGDYITHVASIGAHFPFALIQINVGVGTMFLIYGLLYLIYLYTTLHTVTRTNETSDTCHNEIWSPVIKF